MQTNYSVHSDIVFLCFPQSKMANFKSIWGGHCAITSRYTLKIKEFIILVSRIIARKYSSAVAYFSFALVEENWLSQGHI